MIMKRIYSLALFFVFAVVSTTSAQTSYIQAPTPQTTTTSIMAPNGTSAHATMRGVYLLSANDLTVVGTNTAINAIGFFVSPGASSNVTGTVQVYLQNTSDLTYQKGISFSTAIAPMTSVYNNTMIVPIGTNTITLPFPTDFTYTGGGLYIAIDWVSTGPFAGTAAAIRLLCRLVKYCR